MNASGVRIAHGYHFVQQTSGDLVTTGLPVTSRLSNHLLKKVLQCFLLSFLALFFQPRTADAQPGIFSATGSLTAERADQTGTLLSNGEVLLAGGCNSDCTYVALASAELYNPATGTFSATGSMNATRFDGQTATLLLNGKVLITGGYSTDYAVPLPNAELYDPATGTFSATGSMVAMRYQHTATLLPNGQVLIVGGCLDTGGSCQTLASAELYDPATETFSATGSLIAERADHTATLLSNGQVLVAGGVDFNSYTSLASAELYDPTSGTFSATGSMITGRESHSAALLPNGQVLVATGYSYSISNFLVSAELYDPIAGTFSATGSMTTGRIYQSAALLANGEFLVVGGDNYSGPLASAELYDPTTGTFSATGFMTTGRGSTSAVLMPDGQILVAGGQGNAGALASAELYSITPPLTVSPATLSFGRQPLGTTGSAKKVTISNKTGLAVTLNSWVLTGTNATDFNVVASTCGGVLKVKASCTVSVVFAPQQTGVRLAALTITDSASNSQQSVSLTGSGILPVSFTPSSLKFPTTKVGTTSLAKIVAITNNLATTLTLSSIIPTGTNAGDFAVQTTTCGPTLTAGSNCAVILAFTPTATGSRAATLSISDGAVTSPQTVALSGTGK
jgi:hypothetical protein